MTDQRHEPAERTYAWGYCKLYCSCGSYMASPTRAGANPSEEDKASAWAMAEEMYVGHLARHDRPE